MLRIRGASLGTTCSQLVSFSRGLSRQWQYPLAIMLVKSGRGMSRMVNLWFGAALLEAGWMEKVRFGTEAGRIERIDIGVKAAPQNERHAVALPGIPNVHSHAFQRAM